MVEGVVVEMGALSGRTAVVTGGSSGVGLASARLFAKEGASVIVVGRDRSRLEAAAGAIGHGSRWVAADLGHDPGATALAARLREMGEMGEEALDVLFANAGASNAPELFDTDEDGFDAVIDTNLKSAFFTVLRCFPLLEEGASMGRVGDPLYAAAKAGVRSLARGLAARPEFLARRIRVNVLSLGAVATPMTGAGDAAMAETLDRWAEDNIPLRRWADPIEAARPALFLASAASDYMTGAEVAVDGGLAQL
jgi:NAD(P)-dependent dehydrogenase (short-subunit alcohol dehydrogenase family)